MGKLTGLTSLYLTLLGLLVSFTPCQGQSNRFTWKFSQDVATSLPQCGSIPITVSASNSATAYYMIALPVGGIPTTTLIGTSQDSLTWVVNQPAGTNLMLYIVDSSGGSGAIPASLFTVTAGSSQCLPPPITPSFIVTTDAKDEISTCDPLKLTIKGGTFPYNILLAALGSLSVTNVTLPDGDDFYTYINRANPNGTLLAAISDAKGRWANGTPFVKTKGSAETTCSGLTSSSGKAPANPGADSGDKTDHDAGAKKSNKTSIIIGVCVAVGCLLLLGGVFIFWFWRRKARTATRMDLEPRKFQEMSSQVLSTSGAAGSSISPNRSKFAGFPVSYASSSAPPTAFHDPRSEGGGSSHDPPSASSATSSPREPASGPTAYGHSSSKALEAVAGASTPSYLPGVQAQFAQQMSHGVLPTVTQSDDSRWPANRQAVSGDLAAPDSNEVIFQHRDAGVVRELPPPYGSQTSGPGQQQHPA